LFTVRRKSKLGVFLLCVCWLTFLLFFGRRNSDTGTKNGNTSESESESSQKSQTGRDFEMVEKEDAQDSTS